MNFYIYIYIVSSTMASEDLIKTFALQYLILEKKGYT